MLSPMVSMNMFCNQDKEMVAIALTPLPLPLLNQVTHSYSAPNPPPPPLPLHHFNSEVPLVLAIIHYVCRFSNICLTALLFYEVHVSLVAPYTKTYFVVLQGEVSEVSNHPQGYFFLYANTF